MTLLDRNARSRDVSRQREGVAVRLSIAMVDIASNPRSKTKRDGIQYSLRGEQHVLLSTLGHINLLCVVPRPPLSWATSRSSFSSCSACIHQARVATLSGIIVGRKRERGRGGTGTACCFVCRCLACTSPTGRGGEGAGSLERYPCERQRDGGGAGVFLLLFLSLLSVTAHTGTYNSSD